MSSGEPNLDSGVNIRNAFVVVRRTYESLEKFLQELDSVAKDEGFVSLIPRFLRLRSDQDTAGWLTRSFIKLYQQATDVPHETIDGLRLGPVYGVDVDLAEDQERPTIYFARFEYDLKLSAWTGLPGLNEHARFHWPRKDHGAWHIQPLGSASISTPKRQDVKRRYLGLERMVFAGTDLVAVKDREDIKVNIFEPLRKLP